jgi:hypothetical protein
MDKPACSVRVCDRPAWARGLCNAHYDRWRRSGAAGDTPVRSLQARDGQCAVQGCERPRKTGGLCGAHYWRVRTHGDPGPAAVAAYRAGPCSVADCGRRTVGRGLCRMHYERQRKGREVGSAAPQKRAAGQGSLVNGYHVITVSPGQSRLAHRVRMESLLGRPLTKGETVHHVNGDRSDNSIDGPLDERYRSGNLELWSSWQPSGQRVSDKIQYAEDLLRRYAPHLLATSGEERGGLRLTGG